jgi:hypothetical protein
VTVPASIFCALLATALAGCCTTAQPTLRELDYPGTLLDPTKLATEAVWQQRVTATWRPRNQEPQERGFDAALQRQGETLTVVGLSPLGTVGFSIQQTKTGIDVVNNIEDQLVIPPRFILLDVQRTFFPWACPEWCAQPDDGTRTGQLAGEEITETWRGGRLQQRTFRRLDNQPAGLITVTYEWQQQAWAVPSRAVLDNAWFGYELSITTSSETRLDPTPEPSESSS